MRDSVLFTGELGFFPVSHVIVIEKQDYDSLDIFELYDHVAEVGCRSLILTDELNGFPSLSWFVYKCRGEGRYITFNTFVTNKVEINYDRHLILSSLSAFRRNHQVMHMVNENDIFLIDESEVSNVSAFRRFAVNVGCKARLAFDTGRISRAQLIDYRIYDIIPANFSQLRMEEDID